MKILAVLFLIIYPFFIENVFACSCDANPAVYESFNTAGAVFTGKVISSRDVDIKRFFTNKNGEKIEYIDKERIFRFQVFEAFKGIKGKEVDINAGETDNSCYSGFSINEEYLIYAQGKDETSLSHGFCSTSKNLEDAQGQIHFIREMLNGKPEPQVYGSVVRSDTFPNSNKRRITEMQGIKILLENSERKIETLTDKKGLFTFNNIPEGKYQLKPDLPAHYQPYYLQSGQVTVLSDGKIEFNLGLGYELSEGAAFAEFTLVWNNNVNVKVFDSEGKLVKFVAVRLLPISQPLMPIYSSYFSDKQNERGFSHSGKTPGNYYLTAEIYAPFENSDKIRIFYPQSETPEKSTPIAIKETSELDFNIILPSKYVIREIKGQIFWSDGQPVDQTHVALRKSETYKENNESNLIEDKGYDFTFTDDQGNFVLQGFENAEYWLHTSSWWKIMDRTVKAESKPIKIKVGKSNEPLKIILTKPSN